MSTLHEVRSEFLRRYYEWRQKECAQEAIAHFVRLKRIKGGTELFLHRMGGLSVDQQIQVMQAHMRRLGVELGFDRVREDDAAILALVPRTFPLTSSPVLYLPKKMRGISAAKLMQRTKQMAAVTLGTRIAGERQELRYSKDISGWKVETFIDFGGRSDLAYCQSLPQLIVRPITSMELAVLRNISMTRWVTAGEAKWNGLTSDEVDPAIADLLEFCAYFFSAAESLLKGLTPP